MISAKIIVANTLLASAAAVRVLFGFCLNIFIPFYCRLIVLGVFPRYVWDVFLSEHHACTQFFCGRSLTFMVGRACLLKFSCRHCSKKSNSLKILSCFVVCLLSNICFFFERTAFERRRCYRHRSWSC